MIIQLLKNGTIPLIRENVHRRFMIVRVLSGIIVLEDEDIQYSTVENTFCWSSILYTECVLFSSIAISCNREN